MKSLFSPLGKGLLIDSFCWPALSPAPQPPCVVLPTSRPPQPAGPGEVSAWERGHIRFEVWPNNFLSCRGVGAGGACLTSFNAACGVLISHAFLSPYFLPCDPSSNSIFHSCYRKSLSVISNIQLHLSLLEEM